MQGKKLQNIKEIMNINMINRKKSSKQINN